VNDIDIARSIRIKPIADVANSFGINDDELISYGPYKAKVKLDILQRLADKPDGKYILVTAMTPTPLGEGKTVNSIGLSLGLNKLGKKSIVNLRQPSMGPIFGIKGGAAGGGYSQVLPLEDVNLGLTGDIHSVSIAHNLCSAFIDNSILRRNPHNLNTNAISFKRVVDLNDRALRDIVVGLGGKSNGITRQTGFIIAVASELMAILALAEDIFDLRKRLGRMIVGYNMDGEAVTADDLNVAGAMTVLLRETILPNLLQTSENTAAFIHTGPFANIAHGNSSIVADRIALKLADFVVTEAGFGADMGAEKFFNIKCRTSGLKPAAALLVATVRAMKHHSGMFPKYSYNDSKSGLFKENTKAVSAGASNLIKQIQNVKAHGVPVVVVFNRFENDTDNELKLAKKIALDAGAERAVIGEAFQGGGEGMTEAAQAIIDVSENDNNFKYLYEIDEKITRKVEILATKLYGAKEVVFLPEATRIIRKLEKLDLDKMPICIAKTQYSLSDDSALLGAPSDYKFVVRDIEVSAGAGFITVIAGDMNLMPGLPRTPGGEQIDIDENGDPKGLF